jgi:hypothetical protein
MLRLSSFAACAVALLLAVTATAAWQQPPPSILASVLSTLPPAEAETAAVALGDAPFPCSYTAPDGTYWDFSPLTTTTGTVFTGVRLSASSCSRNNSRHATSAGDASDVGSECRERRSIDEREPQATISRHRGCANAPMTPPIRRSSLIARLVVVLIARLRAAVLLRCVDAK